MSNIKNILHKGSSACAYIYLYMNKRHAAEEKVKIQKLAKEKKSFYNNYPAEKVDNSMMMIMMSMEVVKKSP